MSNEFVPYKKQDYEALKAECLSSGKLFEDKEFPPTAKSLAGHRSNASAKILQWKRASEICENPKFIIGDMHADDLDQGSIGNCWFISSIAAVATVPEYINKVVPNNQSFDSGDYAGIFHFRIWRYGVWIDVVVDDYLPVNSSGQLEFCKNRVEGNEMFGPLLEKAYAKLNVCYDFIGNGGHPTDALVDLTGGVHENYEVKDNKEVGLKKNITKQALWDLLFKSTSIKSIMGCTIDQMSGQKTEGTIENGLVVGHAYTIMKVVEIIDDKLRTIKEPTDKNSIKLLKIRNPWGLETKWTGDYSENSAKWSSISESLKETLNEEVQAHGNFFVSLADFVKYFNRVHVVHVDLNALAIDEKEDDQEIDYHWSYQGFNGAWIKDKNSGGCGNGDYSKYWLNPQFNISLTLENEVDDKCSLIIDLMQTETVKRKLLKSKKKEEALSYSVYRIKDQSIAQQYISENKKFSQSQLESVGTLPNYLYARQVCRRFDLPEGDYVVIPSTFDKDVDMKFLLRIFTEGAVKDKVKVNILNKNKKKKEIKKEDDIVIPSDVIDSTEKNEEEAKDDAEVPKDLLDEKPDENQDEQVIHEEQKIVGPGPIIDETEIDEDISPEEISELEQEWKDIEDEWNTMLESKGINTKYEQQDDEFYQDDECESEEDIWENYYDVDEECFILGTETDDEEVAEAINKNKNKDRKHRKKNNKTSYTSKIIQVTEGIEEELNKLKNKPSKACSVM